MTKTSNLKTAMTCQVCGRKHQANTGRMAHHGYNVQWSQFVGTCKGARELPFEVSRDELGSHIRSLRGHLELLRAQVVATEEETLAIPHLYGPSRDRKHVAVTVANFDQVGGGHKGYSIFDLTWLDFKATCVKRMERQIKHLNDAITDEEKRFNAWTATHEWDRSAQKWAPLVKQ